MNFYFAPMEGLTDSIYRRLHHSYFSGVTRYYMPFLSPTIHHKLTAKEHRNLPPADSVSFCAVPQVLTKSASDFLWAANCFQEQGYNEINLNLGCPSGTVVSKGKGAGMLGDLYQLETFLDEIFESCPLPISVKTRIGLISGNEFPEILEILNRYPIKELTIHPRVRKVFYKGDVDMNVFSWALDHTSLPVCYNGNMCTKEDLADLESHFPQVQSVMIGRGLIGNPALLSPEPLTRQKLDDFTGHLLDEYCSAFESRRNAMFRMKENWQYLLCLFEGSEDLGKQLRKSTDYDQYRAITHEIIWNLPMYDCLHPNW